MKSRFYLALFMVLTFIALSVISRTVLLFSSFNLINFSIVSIVKIYSVGILYDFIAAIYFVIPFAIYLFLVPSRLFGHKINRFLVWVLFFFQINIIVFSCFAEWFFWEEFGKRFNFIAVDYLVYTHEVIHNILESYPVGFLLISVVILSGIICYLIYGISGGFKKIFALQESFLQRVKIGIFFIILPVIFFYSFDKQKFSEICVNEYNKELCKNGIYSVFSAFRHNTLDYDEFYKTENIGKVMSHLKELLGFNDNYEKHIRKKGKEFRYNIQLIMVESLSAEYMGAFGDKRGLTPNLDKLTEKSLFFKNFYAVGTRTVRGMEAVVLSVPPTPGRSIVKRPDNHNMFSAGFVFKEKGYENKFIYAGFGYFDNMNDFFSHNGFIAVDRTDFKKNEITFSNAWGACDEDLFNKVLKESDKSFQKGKPFFNFIMTTSNHRPYTYPEGRINIPSHTGRAGAVKYTDYAINDFLKKASEKPWFKNTIFIIVADHNAHSAGKTSLPVWRYKIPLIIFAPYIVKPGNVFKLASQIDIMPTIFSLLNWSYISRFYGKDILGQNFNERAFISNYQKLGFLRNSRLTILTPDKRAVEYKVADETLHSVKYVKINPVKTDLFDAITFYQSANYMYKNRLNRRCVHRIN